MLTIPGSAQTQSGTEFRRGSDPPFGISGAWSRPFFREDPDPRAIETAAANEKPYKNVQELGAKWIRPGIDIYWSAIQPGPRYVDSGAFKWALTDNLYGRAPDCVNVLATIRVDQGLEGRSWKFSNQYVEDRYINFVEKTVRRYGSVGSGNMPGLNNRIKCWQVENEPAFTSIAEGHKSLDWEGFSHIQEITYKAIKRIDPTARVAIGGMALGAKVTEPGALQILENERQGFYFPIFKQLAGKYIDIFDIHYYGNGPDWPDNWQGMREIYQLVRQELNKNGYQNSEIWFTETAVPSFPFGEKKQATALLKRYIFPLSLGARKIFWWNLIEGEAHLAIEKPSNHYGLLYDGLGKRDPGYGARKLSWYTCKKLIETLGHDDWDRIETVQNSGGNFICKFSKKSKHVWVAWPEKFPGKPVTISGINSHQVKITEAIPRYESGKDIRKYDTAFSTHTKRVEPGGTVLIEGNFPLFVEEK